MVISERMTDMIERYGEVCQQTKAAKILGVSTRTIARMIDDGRLSRVGCHIDVRSICAYIENPKQADFQAHIRKRRTDVVMSSDDFYTASRHSKKTEKP